MGLGVYFIFLINKLVLVYGSLCVGFTLLVKAEVLPY